jgi:tetratricopeptide (TPR) repeat protein
MNQGVLNAETQRTQRNRREDGVSLRYLGALGVSALKRPVVARLLLAAGVAALAVIAYWNILDNLFVYDDGAQILRNYYIRDAAHLRAIVTTNVWSFLGPHAISNYYRPVMHLIYMADYALFRYQPAGYHATSIVFHALNSILVLLVGEALGLGLAVAALGAALFAVHPIATEAVAWAACIPELAYMFFFLLSFLIYVRVRGDSRSSGDHTGSPLHPRSGRRPVSTAAWLAASVLAALGALFSKETALMLAPAIIVYEHALRRTPERHLARVPYYSGHLAALAFYLAMRVYSLGGFQVATNPYGVMPLGQFLLSALYLFGKYVRKLFVPAPFNIFYVFHPARGLTDWRVLGGVLILSAVAAAFWLLRRRASPLAFAIVLIVLPLVPALDVRAIGHNVFTERYLYLPAAGFCWLLAAAIARIARSQVPSPKSQVGANLGLGTWDLGRLSTICLAVLLLVNYALLTRFRTADWHDDVLLDTVTLQVSPESNLIRDNLGKTFLDGFNRPDLALDLFRECVRRAQRAQQRAEYYYDLAMAYGELRRYPEALESLARSHEFWPDYPEAFLARGDLLCEMGDKQAARQQYSRALEIKPGYAEALNALGRLSFDERRYAEAEQYLRRALAVTELTDANLNLGWLMIEQRRYAEAERALRQVLVSESHSVSAWLGLGIALREQGKVAEAANCFSTALNERKFAHQRRLGRPPLPDAEAIRRQMQVPGSK